MSAAFPDVQRYQPQQVPTQPVPMQAAFPDVQLYHQPNQVPTQQVPMQASFPEMRPYQPQLYQQFPPYY